MAYGVDICFWLFSPSLEASLFPRCLSFRLSLRAVRGSPSRPCAVRACSIPVRPSFVRASSLSSSPLPSRRRHVSSSPLAYVARSPAIPPPRARAGPCRGAGSRLSVSRCEMSLEAGAKGPRYQHDGAPRWVASAASRQTPTPPAPGATAPAGWLPPGVSRLLPPLLHPPAGCWALAPEAAHARNQSTPHSGILSKRALAARRRSRSGRGSRELKVIGLTQYAWGAISPVYLGPGRESPWTTSVSGRNVRMSGMSPPHAA